MAAVLLALQDFLSPSGEQDSRVQREEGRVSPEIPQRHPSIG
jgi:hypothetical protein